MNPQSDTYYLKQLSQGIDPKVGISQYEHIAATSTYTPAAAAELEIKDWQDFLKREIDLREKINHPLYFPTIPINDRKSLFDVIKFAVVEEKTLTAYDPIDDEFTVPLTVAEAIGKRLEADGYVPIK